MQTLKAIREQLQWSYAEMAESLKLSKATYQCYDEGREPPPEVLKLAQETLERSLAHSSRYESGGELDRIMADVPMFMSE
jgi:transcriptional regulator with XRE-family HTH domain